MLVQCTTWHLMEELLNWNRHDFVQSFAIVRCRVVRLLWVSKMAPRIIEPHILQLGFELPYLVISGGYTHMPHMLSRGEKQRNAPGWPSWTHWTLFPTWHRDVSHPAKTWTKWKNGEGGVGVPDVVVQGVFEIHMFPLNFGFVWCHGVL